MLKTNFAQHHSNHETYALQITPTKINITSQPMGLVVAAQQQVQEHIQPQEQIQPEQLCLEYDDVPAVDEEDSHSEPEEDETIYSQDYKYYLDDWCVSGEEGTASYVFSKDVNKMTLEWVKRYSCMHACAITLSPFVPDTITCHRYTRGTPEEHFEKNKKARTEDRKQMVTHAALEVGTDVMESDNPGKINVIVPSQKQLYEVSLQQNQHDPFLQPVGSSDVEHTARYAFTHCKSVILSHVTCSRDFYTLRCRLLSTVPRKQKPNNGLYKGGCEFYKHLLDRWTPPPPPTRLGGVPKPD
jgi:hypothetical protein